MFGRTFLSGPYASSASRRRSATSLCVAVGLFGFAAEAGAQVTEPNGVVVPGPPNTPGEQTLQEFFAEQGEAIDPVTEASTEPSVFSPLCDFEVTLMLSESQAQAGLAWYNVPAEPTGAPTAVYTILQPGTPVGQVIQSADIRGSAEYLGGLVGFALMKDGSVAYYSEFRRNVFCSQCAMPDYWKMALAYRSTVYANTYYLGFEDWEGATESTWHQNDGDFNDKVFRVTGVSCPGGGEPCETGLPGVCAPGLTECVFAGELECKQQVPSSDETCDGLDNDCDGDIDNGDLCAADEICDRGQCVKRCGEVLVTCTASQVCSAEGYCVDAECAEIDCPAGQVCFDGECREPCEGVVCPFPYACLAGRCADPCEGVECDPGRVCERGVCVLECDCQVCSDGLECATAAGPLTGHCVDEGCGEMTCDEGTVCSDGTCVDACIDAACPRGERCLGGECVNACTDVSCEAGQKCDAGVCVDSCSDVQCAPGFKCVPGDDSQGECVDGCQGVDCGEGRTCTNGSCGADCTGVTCTNPGEVCVAGACMNPCATLTCGADEVCRNGGCVGVCEGVQCGAGQICENGICIASGTPIPDAGAPMPDGGGTGGSAQNNGSDSRRGGEAGSGCGCRLHGERSFDLAWLGLLLAGAWLRRRHARLPG